MTVRRRVGSVGVLLVAIFITARPARTQQPLTPRKLAPGILTVISPAPREGETYTGPLHLKELPTLDYTPNFSPPTSIVREQAKHVIFRREVWNLEFAFKPLRMIQADVPQPDGTLKKKLIWYMVYRIRNLGNAVVPKPQEDAFGHKRYVTEEVDEIDPELMADRFFPLFVLEGWTHDVISGVYKKIPYVDRVLPGVIQQIRAEEDPAIPLLNSVEISQVRIPLTDETTSHSVWGIVTWEDVDPRIDFASIYIQGLTNAFRFRDTADGKRTYTHKTLQLNFWRPGDTRDENEDSIRFGVPLVSEPLEQVQIFQMYGIPGPLVSAYEAETISERESRLFQVDAELDARLNSQIQQQLDAGNLPEIIKQQFALSGVLIPDATALTPFIPGSQWEFTASVDSVTKLYRLRYEPVYWEMTQTGLNIKERVDHIWIYR